MHGTVAEVNEAELEKRLGVLEMARAWSPRLISRFESFLRSAGDEALFRCNPVAYAAATGASEDEAIGLFLHAARGGLLDMEWNLVCASCGHMVKSLRSMSGLHAHYECDMCFAANEAGMDDLIHVTFTVSPEIRRIAFHDPGALDVADFHFKYSMAKGMLPLPLPGNPTFNDILRSWTRLLTFLEPGESHQVELEAPAGSLFRITDLLNGTVCAIFLNAEVPPAETRLRVGLVEGRLRVDNLPTAAMVLETPNFNYGFAETCRAPTGRIVLGIENGSDRRSAAWIVQAPTDIDPPRLAFERFLSGHRLLTSQVFRELFGEEALDETQCIGVKDVTFLVADLKESSALCDRLGDARVYHLVRQQEQALTSIVAGHAGAVVRAVGDTLMAAFRDPIDAVPAAIAMLRKAEAIGATAGDAPPLRIGVHRGHAVVVARNGRTDYFGQAVNAAGRLSRLAEPGEIVVGDAVCRHDEACDLLDREAMAAARDAGSARIYPILERVAPARPR